MSLLSKRRTTRSLPSYKDYLFYVNLKKQFKERNNQLYRMRTGLSLVAILVGMSTLLKLFNICYTLVYGAQIANAARSLGATLLNGIKVVSAAMTFEMVNVIVHTGILTSLIL